MNFIYLFLGLDLKGVQIVSNDEINDNANSPSAMILSTNNRQNKASTLNCPRNCPALATPQEPVCGSDGLIYANACEMKKKTCIRNGVSNVKVSLLLPFLFLFMN